jgi:uncharacterized membrane protein YgdD (TMEM256/DUF423 family)
MTYLRSVVGYGMRWFSRQDDGGSGRITIPKEKRNSGGRNICYSWHSLYSNKEGELKRLRDQQWFEPHVTLALGAVLAAIGVAAGAFGAHALRRVLTPDGLSLFEVGVRYLMYHSFGILLTGATAMFAKSHNQLIPNGILLASGFFLAGIVLFSGSLFALAGSGITWLGAITPVGGICFILGWVAAARGFIALRDLHCGCS